MSSVRAKRGGCNSRDAPAAAKRFREERPDSKRGAQLSTRAQGAWEEQERAAWGNGLWLRDDLRVRVVNQEIFWGGLFKQKGVVIDVLDPRTGKCMLKMDGSGQVFEGLVQRSLQTALPKLDGEVLVVRGKHKGQRGILIRIRREMGHAVVQLHHDDRLQKLSLDDVCEFAGRDEWV